jgi:hypothetical protein
VKRTLFVIAGVLLSIASSAPIAENKSKQFTGAALKSSCDASLQMQRQGGEPISIDRMILATMCRSYIVGFIESSAFNESARSIEPLFCLSSAISANEAVRVVHAFATLHPDMLDLPAAAFVAASLEEKFACANGR